jgi:2-dehydro-3-deoxyphosphogluconate aldolase/(4S)-4-hydroxy-2-oxoglutarate aldolase
MPMSFAQNATYFSTTRVIPVLTASSVSTCTEVSRVLFESGLRVQEITLRNSFGLETVAALRSQIPELTVGVGSILTPRQGEQAIAAGAQFLVSPGSTEELLQFAVNCSIPFLPGVATVSEVLRVKELGCDVAKLFPAQILGGTVFLRSLSGPLPFMKFCPTGGIDASLAPQYLALPNVVTVGGSWMAPSNLVSQGKFSEIRGLGELAASL